MGNTRGTRQRHVWHVGNGHFLCWTPCPSPFACCGRSAGVCVKCCTNKMNNETTLLIYSSSDLLFCDLPWIPVLRLINSLQNNASVRHSCLNSPTSHKQGPPPEQSCHYNRILFYYRPNNRPYLYPRRGENYLCRCHSWYIKGRWKAQRECRRVSKFII